MRYCWKWSRDNGMMSNTDYPYTGGGDADCQHDDTKAISYVSEWGKCDSPACALTRLQAGPVAIAVAAGNDCWRFYSSGVLTSADNCPTEVDHAVAIIGLEFGKPIWKKRLECKWFNSWDYQNQSCLADYNGFSCNGRAQVHINLPITSRFNHKTHYSPCHTKDQWSSANRDQRRNNLLATAENVQMKGEPICSPPCKPQMMAQKRSSFIGLYRGYIVEDPWRPFRAPAAPSIENDLRNLPRVVQ